MKLQMLTLLLWMVTKGVVEMSHWPFKTAWLKPTMSVRTFSDYADQVFIPYVVSQMLDLVWDSYRTDSLKCVTHAKRSSCIRRQVTASGPVPRNWQDFLHVDMNKSELFLFLSEHLMKVQSFGDKLVVATGGTSAVISNATCNIFRVDPCT